MGALFGKISEEQPPFAVVRSFEESEANFAAVPIEIREYPAILVIETKYSPQGTLDSGDGEFGRLARYIGVFATPNNERKEGISMTAPVLLSNPTALHKTEDRPDERSMAFVLPASKYKTIDDVPAPTDPRVQVREVQSRRMAVLRFSGNLREAKVKEKIAELLEALEKDPVFKSVEPLQWFVAGYNAPFVLPWCKKNEVMVVVDERSKM